MNVAIKEVPKSLLHNKHELFRSTDLDETRSLVGDVYCDHKLQITNGALDAFHYHIPFDGISFNYMGYGAECIIEPGCLGDFYLLQLPLKGHATIVADGHEFHSHPGKASILNPNSYTKMRWSGGCEQLLVQIEKRKVNSSLAGCLGRTFGEEVSFNPNIIENDEKQSAWWRHVISFIQQYNQTNSFYQNQCVLSNELETIVKNLLFTLEHNHSARLITNDRAVLPKHVHKATEHIREHFSENLGIHDLVKLTGVSERCLFEGFKQNLSVSPMQFLMQVRLANVRDELLKKPFDDCGNITQVALNNGFTQLGRFSSYYKDMFGELPSQTVKGKKNLPDA